MGVLDEILAELRLTDADRDALGKKRGFTDDHVQHAQFKSGGAYVRDIVMRAAQRHGDDVCIQAGVMYATKSGRARVQAALLEDGRVIIPYFRGGLCVLLRPHQRQPAGKPIIPYMANDAWAPDARGAGLMPYTCYDPQRVAVLAEGEFKAQAARALGWQAFSVQGINQFAGAGFETLLEILEAYDIHSIVVLYDNENRSDPASPRYQSNAQMRYLTQYSAWRMAQMLGTNDRIRINARIGWIPDSWRDGSGKADIDGMLAAGCTPEQFALVIDGALSPERYIETLPPEAVALLNKKHARELGWNRDIRLLEKRGIYVYLTEEAGAREVSNFTAEYGGTRAHPDGTRTWVLDLTNSDGDTASLEVGGRDVADSKRFRAACTAKGKFFWSGRDQAIEDLFHLVLPPDERVVHMRPRSIGWDEQLRHWLFTNCAVDDAGRITEYDADGSIVLDGRRYAMIDDGGDLPEAHFAAGGTTWDKGALHDLARKLAENFDSDDVVLALAWMCAVVLKPWLFQINRTFPILFVFGRKGSGKTRLLQWLTRIFFNHDVGGTETLIGQNSAAFIRNRASQLSYLPLWLDEYRNSEASARHLDVLRGIYDHSGAGISSAQVGANKFFRLRCALAVSGEDEPDDPTGALNERMVSVRIPDKISGRHFGLIEQMQYGFDGIFLYLLRERGKLVPAIQARYEQLVERHRGAGAGNRVAINYAMVHAAADVLLGWSFSDSRIEQVFADIQAENDDSDPLTDMLVTAAAHMPRLGDLKLEGAMVVRHSTQTGNLCLLFNLRTCAQALALARSRAGQRAPSIRTLKKLMRNSVWIDRESRVYRINDRVARYHEADLDSAPQAVIEVAHNIADAAERSMLASRYAGDQGPLADIHE